MKQNFHFKICSAFMAVIIGFTSLYISGCTATQINSAITKISYYIPTAISLTTEALAIYTAISGTTDSSNQSISTALNTINADLANLKVLTTTYTTATSKSTKTSTWNNIITLSDTLSTDADNILAIASVKNSDSKTAGVVIIASLDAAIHIIDGVVSSTESTSTVEAKMAARPYKLSYIETKWSPSDKQMISNAAGVPYPVALQYAKSQGF
jgi:hypothetical protein